MNNILQDKLKKYKLYYNYSYQYKDYDMSDYYELKIKKLKLDILIDKLVTKNVDKNELLSRAILNCKELDKNNNNLRTIL